MKQLSVQYRYRYQDQLMVLHKSTDKDTITWVLMDEEKEIIGAKVTDKDEQAESIINHIILRRSYEQVNENKNTGWIIKLGRKFFTG